jgi:hypothetical protein
LKTLHGRPCAIYACGDACRGIAIYALDLASLIVCLEDAIDTGARILDNRSCLTFFQTEGFREFAINAFYVCGFLKAS